MLHTHTHTHTQHQLFSDILFYDIVSLKSLIAADIERESALSPDELARRLEELRVGKPLPDAGPDVAKMQVEVLTGKEIGDPEVKAAEGPSVTSGGVGCFLCGTMTHDEATCKFNGGNQTAG